MCCCLLFYRLTLFLAAVLVWIYQITDSLNSPQVEFCGYTIPHPSETKMNLRIQTYGMFDCPLSWIAVLLFALNKADLWNADTTNAVEALEKGLDSLMDLCDVVTDKFTASRDAFNASEADKMSS